MEAIAAIQAQTAIAVALLIGLGAMGTAIGFGLLGGEVGRTRLVVSWTDK